MPPRTSWFADVDDPDVDDATAHHIFRVLRLRDGETVTVTDGRGRWRPCRVVARGTRARRVRHTRRDAREPPAHGRLRDPQGRSSGVDRAEADRARRRPDRRPPHRTFGRPLGGRSGPPAHRQAAACGHRSAPAIARIVVTRDRRSGGRDRRGARRSRSPNRAAVHSPPATTGSRSGRRADGPTASWRWRSIGSISAPLSCGSRQRLSPERLGW